ncbi:hypothetical protein NKDENANG_03760 [Candidatus Entotheonellaceae bacterium PAL068K]
MGAMQIQTLYPLPHYKIFTLQGQVLRFVRVGDRLPEATHVLATRDSMPHVGAFCVLCGDLSLRVELYQIHWVITAPGIVRTMVIPTLEWWSGRLGPRTLYLCSIGIFGAGTLGSALAWDWSAPIAFRILTGVGGGQIELYHPEPLVEFRLFRHLLFIMAVVVMFIITMAFCSTGPMMPVLMQRLLGFEPLRVAWTMLPASIVNDLAVMLAGHLSGRVSPQVLVIAGLALYATTFARFAGINELPPAMDTLGLGATVREVQNILAWTGEVATQISGLAMV